MNSYERTMSKPTLHQLGKLRKGQIVPVELRDGRVVAGKILATPRFVSRHSGYPSGAQYLFRISHPGASGKIAYKEIGGHQILRVPTRSAVGRYRHKASRDPKRPNHFELSNIPGTKAEQRKLADKWLIAREKPIEIRKDGSKWEVLVLGHSVGHTKTKSLAESAAHQIGRYYLNLGDFVHTYTKGYSSRDKERPSKRDASPRCRVGTEVQSVILDNQFFSRAQAKGWIERHGFQAKKIDTTDESFRFRQHEPSEFVGDSFRTITLRPGVKAVIGCPR